MSTLNNSIIICDMSPKTIRKRTPIRGKKMTKIKRKTYYESPLKHIQLSNKRWEQILTTKKLIRKRERAAKKCNFVRSKRNASLQDSVVILSDNESELNSKKNQNNVDCDSSSKKGENNNSYTKDKDSSIIVLEPVCKLSTENNKGGECLDMLKRKRKRKTSVTALKNNSSCILLTDTEDSKTATEMDGENIDSENKGSDDIVVVWSSTKTSPLKNKHVSEKQSTEQAHIDEEKSNKLFMIDCSPNIKNLHILERNEDPPNKKRKILAMEENQQNNDLPFNTAGLQLPKARNISSQIAKKKAKLRKKLLASKKDPPSSNKNTVSTAESATSLEKVQCENTPTGALREIVIDGNNIAIGHSKNKYYFSETGLKLVIDYFKNRGHTVKVFVPQYRRSIVHQLLEDLYNEGIVVFTPSRKVADRMIAPYDDRYILEYATMCQGIVISSDQYRDLYREKPEWRDTIANRLMAPTFVGDYVMFPEDPLGRHGPNLEQFLRH